MSLLELYRTTILDHSREPRNRGDTASCDIIEREYNPLCGDEIEIGITSRAGDLTEVVFRGRGCSLCIASASIMTEAVRGKSCATVVDACRSVRNWFNHEDRTPLCDPDLEALRAVGGSPGRQRCITLAWEALQTAVERISAGYR